MFLVGRSTPRELAMSTVFWNREIVKVVSLRPLDFGILPVDAAATRETERSSWTNIRTRGPLLVDGSRSRRDATRRRSRPGRTTMSSSFPATAAPAQLRTLVTGLVGLGNRRRRVASGLAQSTPASTLRGRVTFSLSVPRSSPRSSVFKFRLPEQAPEQ